MIFSGLPSFLASSVRTSFSCATSASKNGKVKSFVRYEVGEGIEKKEENFAEEVMSQIK